MLNINKVVKLNLIKMTKFNRVNIQLDSSVSITKSKVKAI